jgi:hypothetical protein
MTTDHSTAAACTGDAAIHRAYGNAMTTNESYSADALLKFLKQAGMEGLINPAAARARRKAAEQLVAELSDEERADIRRIDVDDLVSRFHKLEGSSIRSETLRVYAERFRHALDEYLDWLDDPQSFMGARREKARAFVRGPEAVAPEQRAAERVTLEATENPPNVVPVQIRDDHVVYLANLPLKLTGDEADKIARVVRAFAAGDDEDSGS